MKDRTIYLYCPDCGSSEIGRTKDDLLATEDDTVEVRCENCGEEIPIGDYKLSVWRVLQLLKEGI